ncbi:hypothetical protein EJ02DRAFT_497904, partial [Clathrospora elynae]
MMASRKFHCAGLSRCPASWLAVMLSPSLELVNSCMKLGRMLRDGSLFPPCFRHLIMLLQIWSSMPYALVCSLYFLETSCRKKILRTSLAMSTCGAECEFIDVDIWYRVNFSR